MIGGNYYTWFNRIGTKSRKVLYQLESLGITKFSQEKEKKQGWYKYKWELTEKGKKIVEKDKNLQNLWKLGRVVEFYNSIKDFL